MNLTGAILTVAGMVSVASLPFVMAWIEETFMTDTRVKQRPH